MLILLQPSDGQADILSSDGLPSRVGRELQSFFADFDGEFFDDFSQFFRCIVPYSPGTALFYEPMNRSG